MGIHERIKTDRVVNNSIGRIYCFAIINGVIIFTSDVARAEMSSGAVVAVSDSTLTTQ